MFGRRKLATRMGGVVQGFKEFLMRGNLIELSVAVIVGSVFTNVVTSFTNMLMDLIGKVGKVPDFSRTSVFGVGIGAFLSALLAFLLTSSIVYFGIVLPYKWLTGLWHTEQAERTATSEELLTEIRDLLREQRLATATAPPDEPTDLTEYRRSLAQPPLQPVEAAPA